MKKKILALLLCALALFSTTACDGTNFLPPIGDILGSSEEANDGALDAGGEEETEEEPEEEPAPPMEEEERIEAEDPPDSTETEDVILRQALIPVSISASSSLAPWETKTYDASCAIDGDTDTAWVENASGLGLGEWIELQFGEETLVEEVQFYNGYGAVYDKNGILEVVTISFSDSSSYSYNVVGHWNTIVLPNAVETSSVRLTIESARSAGDEDTCISEIIVFNKSESSATEGISHEGNGEA